MGWGWFLKMLGVFVVVFVFWLIFRFWVFVDSFEFVLEGEGKEKEGRKDEVYVYKVVSFSFIYIRIFSWVFSLREVLDWLSFFIRRFLDFWRVSNYLVIILFIVLLRVIIFW